VKILETERLVIRECVREDAPFVLELLNSPKFLQFIGDRLVRTDEDARCYIETRFLASYRDNGHGLYAVELKGDGNPNSGANSPQSIGLCGLVKRPSLDRPDLGFAFLPEFEGRGYGGESAAAIIEHAKRELGLTSLLAITTLDNAASISLLNKLGFKHQRVIDENGERLNLFELNLDEDPNDSGLIQI
jgi:ribosomal-protein-alanine N-acetyltransferase